MPVTVSYPGVYIDEVSSGVHTITSVSTSIAAFFGRTSKGKLNQAIRCLSPADFTRNFGAPHPQSDLGFSPTAARTATSCAWPTARNRRRSRCGDCLRVRKRC